MKRILEDESGYILDGKVYLKAYLTFPDRIIGEVRKTEEEAKDYFKNRFVLAESKVSTLVEEVEVAQNKGSYLTKLVQLRKILFEFYGWGNFAPLLQKLDKQELELLELIKTNQQKNLEIKNALMDDVLAISQQVIDWNDSTVQIQDVKAKWLKTGPVEKELDESIEWKFQELVDDFFKERREYYAEKAREIDIQIKKIDAIIAEADQLSKEEDVDASFEKIKQLQARWKQIENVPPKRLKFLWKIFKYSTDRFFDKYNKAKGINPRLRVDPKIAVLQQMAKDAEGMAYEQNIVAAAAKAKEMLNEWKNLSSKIRFGLEQSISDSFRLSCDKVFEMNYLRRVIGYRHPDFDDKPLFDRLKIQIHQMDYLVKKEGTALSQGISLQNEVLTPQQTQIQKRKIAVKEMILNDLKDALNKI